MRLVIDSLIALMLVGILAVVMIHYRSSRTRITDLSKIHAALAILHEQAAFQAALGIVERTDAGYPDHVSPDWFEGTVPVNTLLVDKHPWIDVAPPGDRSDQPPDPVIRRAEQAGFWYNPARGVFRARVMPEATDALTLEVYNRVNGTGLSRLPFNNPDRAPITLPIPATATATVDHAIEFTPGVVAEPEPTPREPARRRTLSDL